MKKKHNYYKLIIIYGLVLLTILMGFNVFGSTKDWLNQHILFPEYFRQIFYSTGKFIPNLAFHVGAGENIFNFAYYGLMSPIILVSYLVPFIKMKLFMIISGIILYLLSGIFMFKFINKNFHNDKYAFYASIIFLTLPILTYHFHHHIMFVFYIPFLLLALIEVDNYIDTNRSFKLIIYILCIILVNYYYSVSALLTIFVYYIYKLILKKKFNIKYLIKMISIFVIPIMISAFILLPVGYTILNANRFINNVSQEITTLNLFIINFKELFYSAFSLGLSGIFFIALFGNLYNKKKNASNYFLNISLIVLLIPIFMYALNGFLYIRGKSLIPLSILYIYAFLLFIKNLKHIDFYKLTKTILIVLIIVCLLNRGNAFYIIEIIFSGYVLQKYLSNRRKYNKMFYGYILLVSLVSSLVFNYRFEDNISIKNNIDYNNYVHNIEELSKVKSKGYYRTDNIYESNLLVNKVFNDNYLSNSMYSSTYNYDYYNFYNSFGNNIMYRNNLVLTGSDNELFYTFMGSKYLINSKDKYMYYKKIKSKDGISLYYNKDAYPLVYTSKKLGSSKTYNSLSFPYNMEYIMNNTVIKDNDDINYESNIKEYYDSKIKDNYKFVNEDIVHKKIKLDKSVKGKMLYISFDMNYNDEYEDSYITINGVKNLLTCKRWRYYNNNNNFKYVLYMTNNKLDIELSEGIFDISNIKIYYSDKIINKYKQIDNLKFDYKNSVITGSYNNKSNDKYLVTSIPYDDGFKAYINGNRVDIVKVNKSFIGFKLNENMNNIKITYESPWYKEGNFISLIGLFLLVLKFLSGFIDNKIINKKLF